MKFQYVFKTQENKEITVRTGSISPEPDVSYPSF